MNDGAARAQAAGAWSRAGFLAGAAVGGVDAGWAIARGVGGLLPPKAAVLFLLATTWGALAGLAAGLLAALGSLALSKVAARRPWLYEAIATAVAAPFVARTAGAAFSGRWAATIPGHTAFATGLAGVGLVGLYGILGRYRRLIAGDAGSTTGGRRAAGVAFVAVSLISEVGNQLILPRLYPWFHTALAVVTGLAALLALRLGWAPPNARSRPSFRRWLRDALVIAATLPLAIFAGRHAHRSQVVRFAALERTAATAQLLRLSPLSLRSRSYVAAQVHEAEGALPPLPEGPRRPDANVVLITVDALRADHVGAFGYKRRPTTPHIDALAARSVRFSRAYAQAPHTSFSVSTMLTGKYFPTLARLAPAEAHDPIAATLRQYGWRTAAFYPPAVFYVDAQKVQAYADTNFGFEYVKFEYMEAQKRVDQIIHYYEEVKPRHSFVWVHFFEPHEPYVAHPEFPFGGGDMDRYDSEIAYTDAAIGRLLDYIDAHLPSTVVVLAADHGEEFDEHGGRYHGSSLFEEQLHVPLVISVPGVAPREIAEPVELVDISPTVLNLLDIPVPARMRGVDLGPWLAIAPAPPERLPPAFAEVEDKRMVVKHSDKLICDLSWGFCSFYDLAVDPGEHQNRADDAPERVAQLRGILDDWLDGHLRFEPVLAKGAANPNGERVPKAIERGRLGDATAAPALAALLSSAATPLVVRQEAVELLVGLPARPETRALLVAALGDSDITLADWAAVGAARVGDDTSLARVRGLLGDPARAKKLRVRAALALAIRGDRTGVPTLAQALDDCHDDLSFCRLIIGQLGQLKDRRGVPALLKHLPDVMNRREMVDALGELGDPAAIPALIERLRDDAYVPVRAQAALALAKIGRGLPSEVAVKQVYSALDRASHEDTEALVSSAAREAKAVLQSHRSP